MRLLLSTLFIGASCAVAGVVTLAWDPSPDPTVAGYYIYGSTNHLSDTNVHSAPIRIDAGTNLMVKLDTMNGGTWFFVATAYDQQGTNRFESDVSNEVSVRWPAPPRQLLTLVPQYAATLAGTNWQDAGFFRVRIEAP